MEIVVLGSSSKGNCYLLRNDKETLVIECGLPFVEVQKALSYDLKSVVGALVSHRHNDHAGYAGQFARRGITIYANEDTIKAQDTTTRCFCKPVREKCSYTIGSFFVMPLVVTHDVPCFAYLIAHKEIGRLLFVTDTCGFKYKLADLNHIMIEANYADDILEENIKEGSVLPVQRTRLLKTHMELETTKRILSRLQGEELQDVMIIHLSSGNSDSERFTSEIQQVTGVPTYSAKPNLRVNL